MALYLKFSSYIGQHIAVHALFKKSLFCIFCLLVVMFIVFMFNIIIGFGAPFYYLFSIYSPYVLFHFIKCIVWPWLTKLCRSQVHGSTAHHEYTVLCVHHPKSGLRPSPFIPLGPPPPPFALCFCCVSSSLPFKKLFEYLCYFSMVALDQRRQTHFHRGPHQPRGCPQRAECNFRTVQM